MRHADYAWLTIACGVCAYEAYAAFCGAELLSEACDRYRRRHPLLTTALIAYLAAHLTRVIPRRIDPLHRLVTCPR